MFLFNSTLQNEVKFMEAFGQNVKAYLLGLLFLICTLYLAFVPGQSDFLQICTSFFPAFIIYLFILFSPLGKDNFNLFLGLAILCRFILIFSFPNLSDDIYRFIWDGELIGNGVNPFDLLPEAALQEGYAGIDQNLYDQLNSKEYYTIYPPVCQSIFGISTMISEGIKMPAMIMKAFMFLFEVGSIFLVIKTLTILSLPKSNVFIYALNPLILLEIMGNLHFEGAMVFFLVLCFYFLLKNKILAAALAMALSICSKLLPLMFLPSLLNKLGIKKSVLFMFLQQFALCFFSIP